MTVPVVYGGALVARITPAPGWALQRKVTLRDPEGLVFEGGGAPVFVLHTLAEPGAAVRMAYVDVADRAPVEQVRLHGVPVGTLELVS